MCPFPAASTVTEVDALPGHTDQPWLYAWAWLVESAGWLRARSFPTWAGIEEDEASGAAAVLMGAALGRELQISQGVGSEIVARPGPGGTVEIGGRCNLVEVRDGVFLHRKGAAPGDGCDVLIAGTRGTRSFLVAAHAGSDANYSVAHGAGRKMSRSDALQVSQKF